MAEDSSRGINDSVMKMTVSARKQRKRLHTRDSTSSRKSMVIPLSPELRKQHGVKKAPLRKGDTVTVMKGDKEIRGVEGKVSKVDTRSRKVTIDGITIAKADGKQSARPVFFSNLMITVMAQDPKRNFKKEA